MSAKNSTFLNTLLGVTWGASTTSASLYLFLPVNLTIDILANIFYFGIRELAGSPAPENWYSHYAFRDAYFGVHSKRQGAVSLSLNGLIPHAFNAPTGAMTNGQVVWMRKRDQEAYDLPRMLEVWDIDGATYGGTKLEPFDNTAGVESAVALIATTGGKVRLHASPWSRGFSNSVNGDSFTDKPVAGQAFARGMIHLASQLPDDFPTGEATAMRVDEYTVAAAGAHTSVASIETSLSFRLPKGAAKQGDFLEVSAPKVIPVPPAITGKVKDVTTEPYDGFLRRIELDTVVLETELPQTFAPGKLHVRRLLDSAGTDRSVDWQGGPTELTKAEAETLPKVKHFDLLRVEASGGEISFPRLDQVEIQLNLTPAVLEAPDGGSVDLLRAHSRFNASLDDFTEPGKLKVTVADPAVAQGDLLLVRLGNEKKHVIVTAVNGQDVTIFPVLDFTGLQLHGRTLLSVQRWVPAGEKDRGTFTSINGSVMTVDPGRASLFSKGSMVSYAAGGKRAFREVEKITGVKITLFGPVSGSAPFIIEAAQFDSSFKKRTGVDVIKRHRRLKFVSGDKPSVYGTFPQFLLGIRPRTRASHVTFARETIFFTNGLANADQGLHRTWQPLSEGGSDFWLLGGDMPIEVNGSDTFWHFNPEDRNKFEGALEVDLVEYTKAKASRSDGTPAGARVRVHSPEVQVPETPAITDTHSRGVIEHELRHVVQAAQWGPLMFMLPVPGVAKAIATLEVAAGSNPPDWARRLIDNQGLDGLEYASWGGLMQLLYELFIPGETDTKTWQQIFNPVVGSLARLIPDLDPNAGAGEKTGVAILQLIEHVFDFRSWTPGLGLYPWVALDNNRNFLEQQASRASGDIYTTILSADDRFNADYKTYFKKHELREADGERTLGSVTRMMTWADYTTRTVLSLDHGNTTGSPVELNAMGRSPKGEVFSFTADAEVLLPDDLYSGGAGTVDLEGPASLARVHGTFIVVPAGGKVKPRLRSFVPTPPRVNRSTGYYFVPTTPAAYTLKANGFDPAFATDVVNLKVTEGKVTFDDAPVPWARPVAVGAPTNTLPVLKVANGSSRLLSVDGPIAGWTADLDSTAQFTLQAEAKGWRIIAPKAFTAGAKARVRLYRVLPPDDPAFDLTYDSVPTLKGVRSLLPAPAWIPVRDFVVELEHGLDAKVVLNGNPLAEEANFIGWSPRPATVQLTNVGSATNTVTVTLRNAASGVGKVLFAKTAADAPADTLQLDLTAGGPPVAFFVRGKFHFPSENKDDAHIEVVGPDGKVLSDTPLMVRVRKNAMALSDGERDRFLSALAKVNASETGPFAVIRDMHVAAALGEAHFNPGFLSWHRAYLLDLEREMQKFDRSVTLPYWKFDEAAPKIFTAEFLGEPVKGLSVRFVAGHPLEFWKTDHVIGFQRDARFDIAKEPAGNGTGTFVLSETDTLDLGPNYADFVVMEGNPHGRAHIAWDGPLHNPPTAPRDPLFFLLHANVDRLWAKWQKKTTHFDLNVAGTYMHLPADSRGERIGHNLLDTMWPWNGVTGGLRPPTAPGNGIPPSPVTKAPPKQPTVGNMIDYQGRLDPDAWQATDYDDIEF